MVNEPEETPSLVISTCSGEAASAPTLLAGGPEAPEAAKRAGEAEHAEPEGAESEGVESEGEPDDDEREPMSLTSKVIYTAAWSIVIVTCAALAFGATQMAGKMDADAVNRHVIVGWGLAALYQWLVVEPVMCLLLASVTLFLKWCTTFEDLMPPLTLGKVLGEPQADPKAAALHALVDKSAPKSTPSKVINKQFSS